MSKKIISVGYLFPGEIAENISITSDRTLLDADIIVFEPKLYYDNFTYNEYKGKPKLSESDSYRAKETANHWKLELNAAFDAGKTIIIFLSKLEECYIYTNQQIQMEPGKRGISNKQVTLFNNYNLLPILIDNIVSVIGNEIEIAKDLKFLAPYWNKFAKYSSYEVYFEGEFNNVILTTKSGNRNIGAIVSGQKGKIILLPPVRYDEDFSYFDEIQEDDVWTKEGIAFGNSLFSSLVEIDKSIRRDKTSTPTPEWAKQELFFLKQEVNIEERIKSIDSQITELQDTRISLESDLAEEGKLRWLLYESGHLLEEAILISLRIMGFQADSYKDSESEFDSVFISPEGRFLGEAEGKDNKAVNIDKIRQLVSNLEEDFARAEIDKHAHGVLFGNSYRLQPPNERPLFFTPKCINNAIHNRIALVRTTDLFTISKYLKENDDPVYAQQCREAIFKTKGSVVEFPSVS